MERREEMERRKGEVRKNEMIARYLVRKSILSGNDEYELS
jgi:hypothetical protein